ncbi:MAG: hypothetical protein AB1491_00280 [Thermodesulfobacteriota bacterium]
MLEPLALHPDLLRRLFYVPPASCFIIGAQDDKDRRAAVFNCLPITGLVGRGRVECQVELGLLDLGSPWPVSFLLKLHFPEIQQTELLAFDMEALLPWWEAVAGCDVLLFFGGPPPHGFEKGKTFRWRNFEELARQWGIVTFPVPHSVLPSILHAFKSLCWVRSAEQLENPERRH